MKKLFFIALFIFITGSVYSQDLIITNNGESINCKITQVNADTIYFTLKHRGVIRKNSLPVSVVKVHQLNYYQNSEISMGEVQKNIVGLNQDYKHFRIAVNGGLSYCTAKMSDIVPADLQDYINELRFGYNFGADFTYFFNKSLGFGLKYNLFNSYNSKDNVYLGNSQYGKISDNIKTSFIGPSFYSRLLDMNNRNTFVMSASFGYLSFEDNQVQIEDCKLTGSTIGLSLNVGYDVKLSEDLSLGFQLSFLQGALNKFDVIEVGRTREVELDEGEYESMNRIDLSVGLVFGK